MNDHNVSLLERLAQALPGWLDLLATVIPETVKVEVSGPLVIAALVALHIWRGKRRE